MPYADSLPFWLQSVMLLGAALIAGYLLRWVIQGLLQWRATRADARLVQSLARRAAVPLGWVLSIAMVYAVLPMAMPAEWIEPARQATWVVQVLAIAWFLARLLMVAEDVIVSRLGVEKADNLRARGMQTQLKVVRQIIVLVVVLLALIVILMSFERLRELGTGLLASAGLAGLVLGLAAQRTLSNLIAGFLVAIAQPIRMDDVVIVEGEWGRIEEITLSYVVVAIWDRRRLIVPISYFLDRPFQNWTRTESKILGPVMLHLDYRVPVDAVRAKVESLVKDHPDWDGEVCGVQVVDTTPREVTVRVLISAADSGRAWDLRCFLREALIGWLAEDYPEALPRTRAVMEPTDEWLRAAAVAGRQ
ncbi:MAG: mechanosensitive ion channel [Gammaproteobacteria bacterium]|nr:mechanosensitive ion channel [Gammaproteobacteria bacterium]